MQQGQDGKDAKALRQIGAQLRSMLGDEDASTTPARPEQSGEMGTMPLKANKADTFEELVQDQLARITAQLETLGRRLDEERPFAPQRPEEVPGYAELKTALHNLVEHLELAEGRTAEAIGSLRNQLQSVAERTAEALETARQSATGEADASLKALEQRVAALDKRLEEMQRSVSEDARAYVDACLNDINDKVRQLEERPAGGVSQEAVAQMVREQMQEQAAAYTRKTEERMSSLVARLQGKLEDLAAGVMDIDRLRTDVERLDTQMRELAGQVAGKADKADIDALKQRMDSLAAQLEKAHGGAPANDERLHALEEQVLQVRQVVEEALGEPLTMIGDKLAAHEKQLAHLRENGGDGERLARLEQTIAQLQQALHESEKAGDAVKGADVAEIHALQAGLADVEKFARTSDGKTREMLQAVQETLAEVVERLIALEDARNDATPEGEKAPAAAATLLGEPAPVQSAAATPQDTMKATVKTAPEGGQASAEERAGAEHAEARDGGKGKDDGLAAEVAQVVASMKASAPHHAETIKSPSAPDSTSAPAPTPAPAATLAPVSQQADSTDANAESVEDFIAAARRAALAASEGGEAPEGVGGGKSRQGLLARLGGLTGRKEKADAAREPQADAPAVMAEADAKDAPARQKRASLLSSIASYRPGKNNKDEGTAAPASESKQKAAAGSRSRLMLAGLVLLSAAALLVNRMQTPAESVDAAPASVEATTQEESAPQHPAAQPKPAETPQEDKKSESKALNEQKKAGSNKQAALPEGTGLFSPRAGGTPIQTASIGAIGAAAHAAASASDAPSPEQAALPAGIGTAALRNAALGGDGKAAYVVAMRYLKGAGVKRDIGKAAQWLRKAAEKGVAVAMYRLGALYEQGAGLPKDALQARVWYERAAARGNVQAMHNLAVLLASGKAGKPDFDAAAHWFRKAAEHGVRDSQFNLAVLYHRGQGVEHSLTDAWFWYSAAAKQGDAAAAEQARKLADWLPKEQLPALRKRLASFTPTPPIRNANVVIIDRPEWRDNAGARVQAASLQAATTTADKPLSGKALVQEVQRLLKKIGYDVGTVDGVMGNRTANAIRLFQLQSRMPVNGRPDMALLRQLRAVAQQG